MMILVEAVQIITFVLLLSESLMPATKWLGFGSRKSLTLPRNHTESCLRGQESVGIEFLDLLDLLEL